MNEAKEPTESIQPDESRVQIRERELEEMKIEGAKREIENTKQSGDYKAGFDQYLANKEEDQVEESLIEQPGKTRAQISKDELDVMKVENTKQSSDHKVAYDQYLNNKEEDIVEKPLTKEEKEPQKTEKPEEPKKSEKTEEEKKAELEAKEEKEAVTERAIENLKALFENKNKLYAQKQRQEKLSYRIKNIFNKKQDKSAVNSEYESVYREYEKTLEGVESLTGKSEDRVIREYLSGNENNEKLVENINNNLDKAEDNLKKEEESQSKEKKDLIERLTGIKDKRTKLLIKAVVAGGMIAFPVGGLAAGALGFGLGEALIGFSLIQYPSVAALAAGNATFAVGGIGGGSVLLSKIMKEARELVSKEGASKEENEEVQAEAPVVEAPKEDTSHEVLENETLDESEPEKTEIKEDEFSNIKNFKELYSRLDEIGSIKSGEASISSEEIKRGIDYLRFSGATEYDIITDKGGLRAKVQELIEQRRDESKK
jgi:hypothetical protein